MGHSEGNPEREVHSNSSLPKENRKKISNKQPNLISIRTRGTTINRPRANRRQKIIKIRAELNNIILNNEWVNNEIKKEIKRYIEKNENENTMTQNLWYIVKIILRGKFRAIQVYLKKNRNLDLAGQVSWLECCPNTPRFQV